MFENYKVPALFLAKNAVCTLAPTYFIWLFVELKIEMHTFLANISPCGFQVLTSFASGRSTSLVVDRCVYIFALLLSLVVETYM